MKKETPQDRWLAKNSVKLTIRLMAESDKDVIERLNSVPNKTDYIRTLIRSDIKQAVTKEDENDFP